MNKKRSNSSPLLWGYIRYGIFFTFFTAIIIVSCKKDFHPVSGQLTNYVNASNLKLWFDQNGSEIKNKSNWLNTLAPNWDKVNLLTVNDSVKVYEVALSNPNKIFVVTKNLSLEQAKNQLSDNTQYRLLVFENLLNGKYNSCVMELVTYDNNLILNKIHYKDYKDLNGAVNFYEINGKFSNGWILDKGIIIRKATLNNNVDFNMLQIGGNTVGGNGKIMLADVNTVTCGRALVPHERTVCVGSGGIEGWGYDGSGGGMTCRQEIYYVSEVQYCQIPSYEIADGGYDGGGGGGGGGGGSTGNSNNTNSDPDCGKVKQQTSTTAYKEKANELKGKTNLKQETGYEEKKDGSFNALNNAGADALNAKPDANTKGFTHTHLNDYQVGDADADGNTTIHKPIRMFSPADVGILMSIINQNRNNGNFSDYYVSVISSYGHYMIKFAGTAADIKTGFGGDEWGNKYKDFMVDYVDLERGFLRFLKEKMGVNGIKLYEIKNNGDIKTIDLKPDGKTKDKKGC